MNVQRVRRSVPPDDVLQPSDAVAVAIEKHSEAMDRATERFGPAADAIASMAGRLDALCLWLKSKKTWAVAVLVWAAAKYAPPDLWEALRPLLQGMN